MLRGLSLALAAALVAVAACSSFTAEEDPLQPQPLAAEAGAAETSTLDAYAPDAADAADAADAGTHLTTGCADGTREELFFTPSVAACEGAWGQPGIRADGVSSCNRMAGNNASMASGCSAEDLCASGWHVCKDQTDVSVNGGANAGPCAMPEGDAGVFYATAQPTSGLSTCVGGDLTSSNDVIGCGDFVRPRPSCSPLNAVITFGVRPGNFFFDAPDNERITARHGTGPGGVLCCRND